MKPKILLLSGYDAASHRQWRNRLVDNLPEFDWTQLVLPARHFAWRTRGSSLSFAFSFSQQLQQPFELIIATSMVDLASLRGFIPQLANIPTLLYFHENQFVFPISNDQPNILNAQLTSIYSALCADVVVFNSAYNRSSFIQGAETLLKRLPDAIPLGLIKSIADKSQVLPVPISDHADSALVKKGVQVSFKKPLNIVWNHRWEYDKQPEVFFAAMDKLRIKGIEFRLHVLGQSFRQIPECFSVAQRNFANQIDSWGFLDEANYLATLRNADIVISTALHDFQGLSMLQAIALGCTPLAPDRVAYPEYIPTQYLYPVGQSSGDESDNLVMKIIDILENYKLNEPLDISAYYLANVLPDYRLLFNKMLKLNQGEQIIVKC